MRVSVVVPTFDERGNVGELLLRLDAALAGWDAEALVVDDSDDDTAGAARAAAAVVRMTVSVRHRLAPVGGLAGAVAEGIARARGEWVVVMDGDLQHPPEAVPPLLARAAAGGADVVVASRYRPGGSGAGLSSPGRALVSRSATLLVRAVLPGRLRGCTDPMSGFFAVRRDAVDVAALRPAGFKILLEVLGRHRLEVAEVPFAFAPRASGASKASVRHGLELVRQLAALRLSRPRAARPAADRGALAARGAGGPGA